MLTRILNPMWPISQLRRDLSGLLDGCGLDVATGFPWSAATFPALNIWEEADAFGAEAEVPGVAPDELEVCAQGNELTIKGRRPTLDGDKVSYLRRERGTGEFTRVVTLPAEIDADKVEAVLKDGVVTIRLPKAGVVKRKKVTVKAG